MTSQAPANSLEDLQKPDDISGYAHRQLIGYAGFSLPILLLIVHEWRPTTGLETLLGSISAYYHTGGVALFVGCLVALAAFLITYEGYDNEGHRADRWTAVIASVAALGVAFFPTAAPAGVHNPSWWTSLTGKIHSASAVLLFGCLIVFSLFLFTKSTRKKGLWRRAFSFSFFREPRNSVYVVCGWVMVGCILWAAIMGYYNKSIFWPEAIALWAFAFSWLAKGRAEWTLRHYVLHPGQMVADLWRTVDRPRTPQYEKAHRLSTVATEHA